MTVGRVVVTVQQALITSRSGLYRLWVFTIKSAERIVLAGGLGAAIYFAILFFFPDFRRAPFDLIPTSISPWALALMALGVIFQMTLIAWLSCLLAGGLARLFYITRLIYHVLGRLGKALFLGIPSLLLMGEMATRILPQTQPEHAYWLGALPTALLFPLCFEYTGQSLPELIPLIKQVYGFSKQCYFRLKGIDPPQDGPDARTQTAPKGFMGKKRAYAEILGIDVTASWAEVKKSYHDLALQYHPDKVQHLGPKLRVVAEQEMKKINEAYRYLEKKL